MQNVRWVGILVSVVMLSVFGSVHTLQASHATLTVVNRSSQNIMSFYAVPKGYPNWGTERLGVDRILPPGRQRVFDLSDGISQNCQYDLKFVGQSGAELLEFNYNVCGSTYMIKDKR